MKIHFVLSGEGTSDLNLVNHIQEILIEEGFSEVSGEAPDLSLFRPPIGRSVGDKLGALQKYHPHADLIFMHRDADNIGSIRREQEILAAAGEANVTEKIIPIIPVTELETWLLTDHEAIKRIAGNRRYQGDINCIPELNRLEDILDAKTTLLDALCEASQVQGRSLRKFRKCFPEMRSRLTNELDPQGPVSRLASYQRFRAKIAEFSRRKLVNLTGDR
ncbi:hypothetical protein Bsp3421_000313 (plasmid) [Burkholderia sp. FERM BP-3421]|uniref:hypothetical protein n=1 Tax=Burkholderia sp. FERM BP-3421 TaxID=1494466 RepID=UPI00235E8C4D|nr:hypothetical protein [Burkholderia sp. FERM BP-3421]WDD90468.1 hypothetical protein Bsp3421_000313 [Burkholderia sp. FERM BP-3421]